MWADARAALAFLTVLPVGWPEGRQPGAAFAWFPLVGLLIGAALAGLALIDWRAAPVGAFVLLLAWVALTGGLHLDGLGDACDGLLAAVDRARRLEIMKDPRAGSWAVVGVGLLLIGKFAAVGALPPHLLIAPPVLGRWAMVIAAYAYPYARSSGLGGHFRAGLGRAQVIAASITATLIVLALAAVDGRALVALVAAPVTLIAGAAFAMQRLGGLTGDIYGALCELVELACLLALCEVAARG